MSFSVWHRYGKIFKERFLSEEFVYTSDPDDLNVIARNEGNAPVRPHLDVIVESRKQEGFPAGITAVQGTYRLDRCSTIVQIFLVTTVDKP